MISNLHAISVINNNKRKEALLSILDEKQFSYNTMKTSFNNTNVTNIIIPFGNGTPRVVIGAHYDSVEGSTGANDNASGIVILIELAFKLKNLTPLIPFDIVFFDHEETGGLGSRAYVKEYGNEVAAMINLDICGVGDAILAAPGDNLKNGILGKAFKKINKANYNLNILRLLPPGDDRIFEEAGIPNVSLGIVESSDVNAMKKLFSKKDSASKDEFPSIIETMHNGPRDKISTVDETALAKMLNFTEVLVKHICY